MPLHNHTSSSNLHSDFLHPHHAYRGRDRPTHLHRDAQQPESYSPHGNTTPPSMRQYASCPSLADEFRRAGASPTASPTRENHRHGGGGFAAYWTSASRPMSSVFDSASSPMGSRPTSPATSPNAAHFASSHRRSTASSPTTPGHPPTSSASSSRGPSPDSADILIRDIIACQSFYTVLGVSKSSTFDEIRRAYLLRSRMVHPDKHPTNPLATEAFQKVASAYTTLKQASTRAAYDLAGEKVPGNGDETLYATLVQLWFEFVEGNFDNLLMVADLLHHHNRDVSRESLESLLQSIRSLMLTCSHCFASAKPGFFQALDLHTQLAALPYLDLMGRLKLSLRLLHVLLTIPITINTAAGGHALPGWSVSTLQAMLGMLDTASSASGKVASVASKLGPQAARDALRSVLVAGPLKRASDGIKHGLGSIVGWRPWHVVWGPTSTQPSVTMQDQASANGTAAHKQLVAAV